MTDFFMMNGFTVFMIAFVVVGLPVIVGCALEAFRVWTRQQEKMATALNAQAAEKAAQYAAHCERLEARVRVLERIATDRGVELTDQIEQLRDDRAIN